MTSEGDKQVSSYTTHSSTGTRVTGRAKRQILIVDPSPQSRFGLQRDVTAGIPQSIVMAVGSAKEALDLVDRLDFDCAFVEASLPDVDGLELVPRLVSATRLSPIPTIIISSREDADLRCRAIDSGAVAFLNKAESRVEDFGNAGIRAIERSRLLRVIDIQDQQIRQLRAERLTYRSRTDELAHELLTPLAAIQEFVSLVLDEVAGPITEEQGKCLAYARGGCASIRNSVESLVVRSDLEQILSDTAGAEEDS